MPEPRAESEASSGQLFALLLAAAAAGLIGIYRPPSAAPPAWGPIGITATAAARREATATAASQATRAAATATEAARATATPSPSPSPSPRPTGASGARPVAPPAPYFGFQRPFAPNHETRASRFYPYGTDADGAYLLHHGVDIGNAQGTEVLAVGPGEVVFAGTDLGGDRWGPQADFYGRLVVLRHPQAISGEPLYSLYGHLSEVKVAAGQELAAGDPVGLVGMAGIALGPHLHLEFRAGADPRDYGSTRNPELLLAPLAGHGTVVGRVLDAEGRLLPEQSVGLYARAADGSATWIGQTESYPAGRVNPSAELSENFLFADLPAGSYRVVATRGGQSLTADLDLEAGQVLDLTLAPEP